MQYDAMKMVLHQRQYINKVIYTNPSTKQVSNRNRKALMMRRRKNTTLSLHSTIVAVVVVNLLVQLLLFPHPIHGWMMSEPVSQLLETHKSGIAALKHACTETIGENAMLQQPYCNDVFFLRYCLESPDNAMDQMEQLHSNLRWRMGPGKSICESAIKAVEEATNDGTWDNDPVLQAAPHSSAISKYITPQCAITTTSNQNDLIYCIRAGSIDDNALMEAVNVDQMVDFFLYAKEVNALVANLRSVDKLAGVITANDLSGVKLVGGSTEFRKALSESSKQATQLYPATNMPTLLLNLPKLVSALVGLFKPLFPPAVRERLRFEQGPLKGITSLEEIAKSGPTRTTFLQQVDNLIYN